jgi:hypothetical protein
VMGQITIVNIDWMWPIGIMFWGSIIALIWWRAPEFYKWFTGRRVNGRFSNNGNGNGNTNKNGNGKYDGS